MKETHKPNKGTIPRLQAKHVEVKRLRFGCIASLPRNIRCDAQPCAAAQRSLCYFLDEEHIQREKVSKLEQALDRACEALTQDRAVPCQMDRRDPKAWKRYFLGEGEE